MRQEQKPTTLVTKRPAAASVVSASPLLIAVALGIVYVVWGSTYLGMDVAVETLPPFLMLALRFLAAGALLYAFTARGSRATWREWAGHSVVGGLMLCVGTGGVAWGVTKIDTGTAALIVASVPLWLTLLDRVANGARLAPAALVGLAVGFGGVGLLVGPGAEGSAVAGIVLVFTSRAWAVGSLGARRVPGNVRPLAAAAMQMIGGGVICALVGVAGGELGRLETPSLDSLIAVVYLVVFGSLVGYTAYVWLLANASMSVVGTYAYVNPIVAVLLGSLFLDERLGWVTLAAGTAVLAAVALIVSARPVAARPTRFAAALPVRGK